MAGSASMDGFVKRTLGMCRGCREVVKSGWQVVHPSDALLFLFFISLLIVAQHVSGNHVPIIRS